MSEIKIPEAVMERVHAELTRSILETPDYINKIVQEVLREPGKSSGYNSEDYGKPLFERVLRAELREMVRTSLLRILREQYAPTVDQAVQTAVDAAPRVEGSLAQAFGRLLEQDYKLQANVTFKIERDK